MRRTIRYMVRRKTRSGGKVLRVFKTKAKAMEYVGKRRLVIYKVYGVMREETFVPVTAVLVFIQ